MDKITKEIKKKFKEAKDKHHEKIKFVNGSEIIKTLSDFGITINSFDGE